MEAEALLALDCYDCDLIYYERMVEDFLVAWNGRETAGWMRVCVDL